MVALVGGHISLLLPKIQLQIAGDKNLYKLSIKCITSRITVNAYMAISMQIIYTYAPNILSMSAATTMTTKGQSDWAQRDDVGCLFAQFIGSR